MIKKVIPILYLLSAAFGLAQDKSYFSELVPPSPDVAQMGTYGATQVGKYTGTANVNVPLHSISLDGLQIPIALSYQTGGIKVSQEASWVGLGWNLSANAVITREINNYDDLVNGEGAVGYLYSTSYSHPITSTEETALFNAYSSPTPYDTEPDLFTISLFGESAQFVLPKKGAGNTVEATVLNSKILKVYYDTSAKTFKVVNGRGFEFHFGNGSNDITKEFTTTYRSVGGASVSTDAGALADGVDYQTIDNGRTKHKLSAWHIDKVVAPSGREITFTYQKAFYFGYPNYADSYDFNICTVTSTHNGVGYLDYDATYRKVVCAITGFEGLHLKQISGDFGTVDFTLSDRLDLSSRYQTSSNFSVALSGNVFANVVKRLTGITVKNAKNEQIKNINFNQSYFNSDQSTDTGSYKKEKYMRLKLDGVTVNDKTYSFTYIQPNDVPAKDSKAVDFWGLYNGQTNATRIPSFGRLVRCGNNNKEYFFNMEGADKGADIAYAKIGLLSRITYPTKGYTDFEYEANEALIDKPTLDPTNPLQNSTDYSYNYQYIRRTLSDDFQRPLALNEDFVINTTNGLPFDYNFEVTADVTCGFNCTGGFTQQYAVQVENLGTGTKYYFHEYNHRGAGNTTTTETYSLPNGTYRMTKLAHIQTPGGAGFTASVVGAQYTAAPDEGLLPFLEFTVGGARIKSVTNRDEDGSFISKKQYIYDHSKLGQIVSSGILMNELVYHSKYGVFDYSPQNFLQVFTMSSGSPLSLKFSAQGSHMGYTHVEEQDVNSTGTAKGRVITSYANEKNQFLTKYIGTTFVIHQQYYNDYHNVPGYYDVHYGNAYLLGVPPISYSYKNGSVVQEDVFDDSGSAYPLKSVSNTYFDYELDSVPVYRAHFSPGGLVTDYGYGQIGNNYLPNANETKDYFGTDYTTTTVNHTYETSRYLPRSTVTTTSESGISRKEERFYPFDSDHGVSAYSHMSDLVTENRVTEPVLVRTYENTTLLSQTLFKFGNFSGKYWRTEVLQAKDNDALTQRMDFVSYDTDGNLREYKQTDGTSVTYVWGYDGMYPVAKVQNATYSQVTGTGVDLTVLDSQTSTDAAKITELNKIRNGLANALVTTYLYKPGVGISSVTDPRGYTMSYEYDTSNRLKTVKDTDDNVVTDYNYHFKGQ